jgi:hypothetical protein
MAGHHSVIRSYFDSTEFNNVMVVHPNMISFVDIPDAWSLSNREQPLPVSEFFVFNESDSLWRMNNSYQHLYAELNSSDGTYQLKPTAFNEAELLKFFLELYDRYIAKVREITNNVTTHKVVLAFALERHLWLRRVYKSDVVEYSQNVDSYIRDDITLEQAILFLSLPSPVPITGELAEKYIAEGADTLPLEWLKTMINTSVL